MNFNGHIHGPLSVSHPMYESLFIIVILKTSRLSSQLETRARFLNINNHQPSLKFNAKHLY